MVKGASDMPLTLELPDDLADALTVEAERSGLSLPEYAARLLATAKPPEAAVRSGTELVRYWQSEGVIGSRPELDDSPVRARQLREQAERRGA